MPFQPPMDLDKLMKLFDPVQMQQMLAPSGSGNFDFNSVMQDHQKNYDAMLEANRSATVAYNDFYQMQMAIFQELMEAARSVAESDEIMQDAEKSTRQAEIYQAATDKALANMTELAIQTRKATEDVFSAIEARISDAVADLKRI